MKGMEYHLKRVYLRFLIYFISRKKEEKNVRHFKIITLCHLIMRDYPTCEWIKCSSLLQYSTISSNVQWLSHLDVSINSSGSLDTWTLFASAFRVPIRYFHFFECHWWNFAATSFNNSCTVPEKLVHRWRHST